MDWLGGLSSIKGQITNITKDLLAEGTREINDPASELSLARSRINELESIIETQKTEINCLRSKNEDLLVQLESSQLMLDHTKELFVQQLREKDAIIAKLRSEVSNERGEPEGQPEASVGSAGSRIDTDAPKSGRRQYPDLVSEEHSSPSVKSHSDGTATWEELKNEVVQLRAELAKWKKIAKKKERNMTNTPSHQVLNIELEKQIEQLKKQLSESEENRRTELAAVQETHSEQLSNLMEQLNETEAEVVKLQNQVETYESCKASDGCRDNNTFEKINIQKIDQSVSTEIVDLLDQDGCESLKKTRPGKKKKKKSASPVESSDPVQICKPVCCEVSLQTECNELKNSSTQANEQVETKEAFTDEVPNQSGCSAFVQTESFIEFMTTEVQTESEYETTTAQISSLTVETQNTNSYLPNDVLNSTPTTTTTTSYDIPSESELLHSGGGGQPQKQSSIISEGFNKSIELSELISQLADEMNMYDQAILDVVNRHKTESSPLLSSDTTALSQPIVFSHSNFDSIGDILEKLRLFKGTIKSRHEYITKSCVSKHSSCPRILESLNETNNMSLSVPVSTAGISGEVSDTTEVELDAWQDDDFPELNTNTSGETKCQSELPTDSSQPDGGDKLQDELSSSPSKLKAKIQQLEEMLTKDNVSNAHRIAELENQLEPFNRLQKSLNKSISHLLSLPPPPTLPSHLLDRKTSCSWPPATVEDQLALLTASEVSARNEIIRLNNSLLSLQEKCRQLELDNQQLYSQMNKRDENEKSSAAAAAAAACIDDQQISDDFVELSSLAYQLCVSLDPEVGEKEWNPDDWEIELFTLLKDRLDSEVTETGDQSDSVVKLSAEVAALRDILAQHTNFRTQAERDLKHLLSTIQNQHDIIDTLSKEKQQLESALSNMESKLPTSTVVSSSATTTRPTSPVVAVVSTENYYSRPDVVRIDTQTQTTLPIDDNLSKIVNKSEEGYEVYCKEMIQCICSMYNEFIDITSEESQSCVALSESCQLTNRKVFSLLEKLNTKLTEYKANSDSFQSVYNSIVNSLQQKHAESQLYHEKLQHCLTELNEANKRREETEILVESLREQLTVKQVETESIVKQSITMNESSPATHKSSVEGLHEMQFDGQTANEERLLAEIERLQAHLVEIEESYTNEAVNAENREVELRGRLAEAEKSLTNLTDSCKTANERVSTAYSERDEALKHLEASRREVLDLKESLSTLQTVLDNFQRNQEAALAAETEHLRSELTRTVQKEMTVRQEMEELHKTLLSYQDLTKDLQQLKSTNQQLREQTIRLETKVKKRDAEVDGLRERLTKMAVDTDARIDKILIKNLLLSYLQLPANQRSNAIRVIGNLVGFSEEDYTKIGNETGTLPKLMGWVRTAVSNIPSGPPKDVLLSSESPNKSFTELLLAFLEEESSPRSSIKLPMDYYTPEMVHPTTNVRRQMSYNTSQGDDQQNPVNKTVITSASLTDPPKPNYTSNDTPVFFMPQQ
ncbi:unnamed protein product [Trichobilharzia szidati]|nr:unnamed protein product [Trichobilharzia szidati]